MSKSLELVLVKSKETKFTLSADINGVHQDFKKPFKDVADICIVLGKMAKSGKVICNIVIKCITEAEYQLKEFDDLNLDVALKEE